MRIKKVRGYKHVLKNIKDWRSRIIDLDLDYFQSSQRDHAKIWVAPYSHLSVGNSRYPQPSGEVRKQILEGLLDSYDSWKRTLDSLGEPYYLKIWLYDQRFSMSQIVCAKGDFLDFYNGTFYKPEEQKNIDPSSYGALSDRIKQLDWEFAWDEEHFNNTSVGEIWEYETEQDFYKTRKWFKNRLKKPHRKLVNSDPDSDIKEYYSFRHGTVWIGG
ncbi:MAG: hypothetical protein ABJR05_10455 [Balneola sp.]